jgi:predicted MFS family arabinose efflux permease
MTKLRRDSATWLIYAQWGVYCYFLYTFTPSVVLIRDDEHISDTLASLHSTAYAAGIVLVGFVGAPLIARVGRDRSMWIAQAVVCLGIVGYVATSIFPVSLGAVLVAGAFGSFLGIGVAASLSDRHGPAGGAALAEANGIASAVGLVAPLAIAASIHLGYGWRPAMVLTLPLVGILGLVAMAVGGRAAASSPSAVPDPSTSDSSPAPAAAAHRLPSAYWPSWLVVVLCVSLEFCMTLWSPLLAKERLHVSSATAATAITAVLVGMSAGRFIGARISERRPIDWILLRSFAVVAAGFAVFWVASAAWLSYLGLVVCGLGIAMHYPLGVARAIASAPGQTDLASSRMSVASGIAIGGGPFLLAFLSDTISVQWAYLLVPVLLLAATTTVLVTRRRVAVMPVAEAAAVPVP